MYKIMMRTTKGEPIWFWYIYGTNGKSILQSEFYFNRTQCRNVMKKFAKKFNMPYKEAV